MSAPAYRLEQVFASSDPEVRRQAVSRIRELDLPAAVVLVIRALGDEDWRVRKEAAQVAVELGPEPELLQGLVDIFKPGDNVGLRNAAVETLASFGAKAVRVVVDALPGLDADGRKLATEVLGRAQDVMAMSALERLSCDPDPNVRVGAIEAVGDLGELALDAASRCLLRVLAGGDLQERLAALDGLNRLGVVVPWPQLVPLLHDPILQRPALIAASRCGSIEAAAVLVGALEQESASLFRIALVGLAELVLDNEASREAWEQQRLSLGARGRARVLDALTPGEPQTDVRAAALVVAALFREPACVDVAIDALVDDRLAREASAALDLFGAQAVPRLLARVAHGDATIRAAVIAKLAVDSLANSEPGVRLALRAAIADGASDVVCASLRALGELGQAEDIAPVLALVASGSPSVVPAAKSALSELGGRYPDDARLSARSRQNDEAFRIGVATLIGALREDVLGRTEEDVAFLAAALSSPDAEARRTAVIALGQVGSSLGADPVQFALADEEREVRIAAVRALGCLRSEDGRPVGTDRLMDVVRESSDPDLVASAVKALGDCGEERSIEFLAPLCREAHPVVAIAAIEAIQALGPGEGHSAIDALLGAVSHPHLEVVKASLLAVDCVHTPEVRGCLGRVLSHAEWDVRRLAADCLGRFGGEDASLLLRERLGCEQEPLVREAISRALNVIESPSTVRRGVTIAPPKADP